VPDLKLRMVDPESIGVDAMNERTDEPLETEELERSIAENGIVEPPVCRVRDEDAKVPYTVVQGQRRVTAAQTMQLDEIPILVGDFDDKRALIRSITENIKAGRKDVTTKTRAAAILRLWQLDQGEDAAVVPKASRVAELLGVPWDTARMWNQPNEEQYRETIVDPRVNEQTNTNDEDLSKEIEDISPTQLLELKKHLFSAYSSSLTSQPIQVGAVFDRSLHRPAAGVEFFRCLPLGGFATGDVFEHADDAVILRSLEQPTVIFLKAERGPAVVVVVARSTSGDPFGYVLLADVGFKLGEDTQHLKESPLVRVALVGVDDEALRHDVQLGLGVTNAVGGSGQVADTASDPRHLEDDDRVDVPGIDSGHHVLVAGPLDRRAG